MAMIVLSYPVFASEIQGQDLVLYSIWAVTGIFSATRANFANEVQIVRFACQPLAFDFRFDCPRLSLTGLHPVDDLARMVQCSST